LSCGFLVCLFLFCVLCAQCYHYLWFVHSWLSIRFSLKLIYTWCMCNKRTESLWPYVCFIYKQSERKCNHLTKQKSTHNHILCGQILHDTISTFN
jgi:hypothetical protein